MRRNNWIKKSCVINKQSLRCISCQTLEWSGSLDFAFVKLDLLQISTSKTFLLTSLKSCLSFDLWSCFLARNIWLNFWILCLPSVLPWMTVKNIDRFCLLIWHSYRWCFMLVMWLHPHVLIWDCSMEFLYRSTAGEGPLVAFGGSDGVIRVLSMITWKVSLKLWSFWCILPCFSKLLMLHCSLLEGTLEDTKELLIVWWHSWLLQAR